MNYVRSLRSHRLSYAALWALLAVVAVGAVAYLATNLREVERSIDASAETAELRNLAHQIEVAANDAREGGDGRALTAAIAAARTQFDSAVDSLAAAAGAARAESARETAGAALDGLQAAALAHADGRGDGMELDSALLVFVDELDAVTAEISSRGMSRTRQLGTLLAVAGIAGGACTILLLAGLQRTRARLNRSDQLLRMRAEAPPPDPFSATDIHLNTWTWDLATNRIQVVDETRPRQQRDRPSEFTPETFLALVHPDDRDLVQRYVDRAIRDGEAYELEHRAVLADGSTIVVRDEVEVIPGEDGAAPALRGTVHDITTNTMVARTSAELSGSNERFRRSLDRSADAAVILNSRLEIVYINDAGLALSGYERDEVVGHFYGQFWVGFELDPELAIEQLEELGSVRFTRDSARKDGSIVTIEHNVIALGDGSYLGVARDLTPAIEAETELRVSEEQFRTVVATVQNALAIIGDRRKPIMVNKALSQMLGYTEQELLAFADIDLMVHPDDRQEVGDATDAILAGRAEASEFHARLMRRDGTAVEIEGHLSAFRLADGSSAVLAEGKDVTKQVAAQREAEIAVRALGESETRLARAQEIARLGNWELDLASGEMWWSDELYRLFGLQPGGLTPDRDRMLAAVHPNDRAHLASWLARAMSATVETPTHCRILGVPGNELTVRWHAEIGRDEAGEPVQVLGTVQDVTEVFRVREQLAEAQKLQAVGTLAAGVAHDFNNLLTVIGGNVTLALDSGGDSALLQPAKRATDRASELVGKLLDFARSGAISESADSHRVIVDMRQPAYDAAAMVESNLDPRTTLHCEVAEEPLFAAAEPGALDRVCINLLFNASEAVDEQRRLTAADQDYRPRIDITLRSIDSPIGDSEHGIELVVNDNGAGMTDEVRARVFEPFFSTKRADRSTGLGLATVYGIVSRLGGVIRVDSAPGKGATFTVRLPQASAIQVEEHQSATDTASAPVAAQLLLVDDEADLVGFADTVLLEAGYGTTTVSSGELALQATQARRFDLILLDVNVGEMDGWSVLEEILRERPEQRVLMWSGVAQHVDARRRGALGMLAKPFDSEKLLDAVSDALRQAPAAGQGGATQPLGDRSSAR